MYRFISELAARDPPTDKSYVRDIQFPSNGAARVEYGPNLVGFLSFYLPDFSSFPRFKRAVKRLNFDGLRF